MILMQAGWTTVPCPATINYINLQIICKDKAKRY